MLGIILEKNLLMTGTFFDIAVSGFWSRITHRRFSCSICWTEPDLCIPSGVAAAVGRCHVVVRLT